MYSTGLIAAECDIFLRYLDGHCDYLEPVPVELESMSERSLRMLFQSVTTSVKGISTGGIVLYKAARKSGLKHFLDGERHSGR
jgi:hypothetical protein